MLLKNAHTFEKISSVINRFPFWYVANPDFIVFWCSHNVKFFFSDDFCGCYEFQKILKKKNIKTFLSVQVILKIESYFLSSHSHGRIYWISINLWIKLENGSDVTFISVPVLIYAFREKKMMRGQLKRAE